MQTRFPICVCLQSLWHTTRMAKRPYNAVIKMLLLHKNNAATSFDVTVVSLSADHSTLCVFQDEILSHKTNCLRKFAPHFFLLFMFCSLNPEFGDKAEFCFALQRNIVAPVFDVCHLYFIKPHFAYISNMGMLRWGQPNYVCCSRAVLYCTSVIKLFGGRLFSCQ